MVAFSWGFDPEVAAVLADLTEMAAWGRAAPVFLLHFHSFATAAVKEPGLVHLECHQVFSRMTFLVQVDLQEHQQKACIGVIDGRVGQGSLKWWD